MNAVVRKEGENSGKFRGERDLGELSSTLPVRSREGKERGHTDEYVDRVPALNCTGSKVIRLLASPERNHFCLMGKIFRAQTPPLNKDSGSRTGIMHAPGL